MSEDSPAIYKTCPPIINSKEEHDDDDDDDDLLEPLQKVDGFVEEAVVAAMQIDGAYAGNGQDDAYQNDGDEQNDEGYAYDEGDDDDGVSYGEMAEVGEGREAGERVDESEALRTESEFSAEEVKAARAQMDAALLQRKAAVNEAVEAERAALVAQERLALAKSLVSDTERSAEELAKTLVDALLREQTPWNKNYRKLVDHKAEYGTANAKRTSAKGRKTLDPHLVKLGGWVGINRKDARRPFDHPDKIEPYKVVALDRLGFSWDPHHERWLTHFQELAHYQQQHGHTLVPISDSGLGAWCQRQKETYRKFQRGEPSEMTHQRITLLNDLGFDWALANARKWEDWFLQLVKFKAERGHCNIHPDDPHYPQLAEWARQQRRFCRTHNTGQNTALTEKRFQQLKALGFLFDKRCVSWIKKYEELLEFKKHHGHCMVPHTYYHNQELASWVQRMRDAVKKEDVEFSSPERIQLMNDIGFEWEVTNEMRYERPWNRTWDETFAEFKHVMKSTDADVDDKSTRERLADWTRKQHEEYNLFIEGRPSSTMTFHRIGMLHTVGFFSVPAEEGTSPPLSTNKLISRANSPTPGKRKQQASTLKPSSSSVPKRKRPAARPVDEEETPCGPYSGIVGEEKRWGPYSGVVGHHLAPPQAYPPLPPGTTTYPPGYYLPPPLPLPPHLMYPLNMMYPLHMHYPPFSSPPLSNNNNIISPTVIGENAAFGEIEKNNVVDKENDTDTTAVVMMNEEEGENDDSIKGKVRDVKKKEEGDEKALESVKNDLTMVEVKETGAETTDKGSGDNDDDEISNISLNLTDEKTFFDSDPKNVDANNDTDTAVIVRKDVETENDIFDKGKVHDAKKKGEEIGVVVVEENTDRGGGDNNDRRNNISSSSPTGEKMASSGENHVDTNKNDTDTVVGLIMAPPLPPTYHPTGYYLPPHLMYPLNMIYPIHMHHSPYPSPSNNNNNTNSIVSSLTGEKASSGEIDMNNVTDTAAGMMNENADNDTDTAVVMMNEEAENAENDADTAVVMVNEEAENDGSNKRDEKVHDATKKDGEK